MKEAMLERVCIRGFSLLRHVDIALGPGLTVITGESGAGKTLLFDAISFALGGRPHRSLLAHGANSCDVELQLNLDAKQAKAAGAPWQPGGNVLVRRLSASGRSQLSVNSVSVNLAQVQPVVEQWFEITGQFESRILFSTKAHLGLLDAFGSSQLEEQLAHYQQQYKQLREAEAKLAALRESSANRAQELEYLSFQVAELERAAVQPGERADVEARLRLLQNAGGLIAAAELAATLLGGGDDQEGAYDIGARASQQITEMERLVGGKLSPVGDLTALAAQAEEVLAGLQELAGRCRDIAAEVQHDPQELQHLLERLDELMRLERKYGCLADELPALLRARQARFELLSDPGQSLEALERDAHIAQERTLDQGQTLSRLRATAAAKLVKSTAKLFRELDFPHVELQVDLAHSIEPKADGLDTAELLITLNIGEPARPLAQVASGGEASRLLLGLKAALANQFSYSVLLLDEVEAGLGADTAAHVAKVLRNLAQGRQVLAITHLPVVAAAGSAHLLVDKVTQDGHAMVSISQLSGEPRQRELIRMLGGTQDAETAALAAKLLQA